MTRVLPYGRQSVDEDDVAAVAAQVRDDWLTQGPTVAKFEKAICEVTGAKHAVAVANGTAALHLACLAANVGPNDVGLVPDMTFVATANAVRYAGARPIMVDVDPLTGLIAMEALEAAVTQHRPKVVLPVSFAGSPSDLSGIQRLARRSGAMVIEDAAHSLGATYGVGDRTFQSASCAHSDMATLSFHPVKHLTTGEGGAVTTNDDALCERLRDLRSHGIVRDPARLERNDGPWYYEQQYLGYNYRISDIQCALGVSQAKKLPRFLERRRSLAAQYDGRFAALADAVRPLAVPSNTRSAYHLYVLTLVARSGESLSSVAERRKALFLGLKTRDIAPQVHYIPIHRHPSFWRARLAEGTFSGAEQYYAGCISLPMFPSLRDEEVDRVVDAVTEVIAEAGNTQARQVR